MDDTAYCVESCGRVAHYERLTGLASVPWDDFTPVVELVCHVHAD